MPHRPSEIPATKLTPNQLLAARRDAADALLKKEAHNEIEELLREAIADAQAYSDIDPRVFSDVLRRRANALSALKSWKDAVCAQRAYIDSRLRIDGAETPHILHAKDSLRWLLLHAGDRPSAIVVTREIWEGRGTLLGESHPDTLVAYMQLAGYTFHEGDYSGAITMYRNIDAMHLEATGAHHPEARGFMQASANKMVETGEALQALVVLRECLDWRDRTLEADDPKIQRSLRSLLAGLSELRRWDEMIEPRQRLIAIYERLGESVTSERMKLGFAYRNVGRYAEAAVEFTFLVDEYMTVYGPTARRTLIARHDRAEVLALLRRYKEALTELAEVIGLVRQHHADDESLLADTLLDLGRVLKTTKRHRQAELASRQAYELHSQASGEESSGAMVALSLVVSSLLAQGNGEDAVRAATTVVAVHEKHSPATAAVLLLAREQLSQAYNETGKADLARTQKVKIAAARKTIAEFLAPDTEEWLQAHQAYVEALRLADEPRLAVEAADKLLELLAASTVGSRKNRQLVERTRLRALEAIGETEQIAKMRGRIAENSGSDYESALAELPAALRLGKIYVADLSYAGDHATAVSVASALLARCEASKQGQGSGARLAQAREILASAYEQQGDLEAAVHQWLLVSTESAERNGMDVEQTLVALKRAQTVAARLGDPATVLTKLAGTIGAGIGKDVLETTALELLNGKLPDIDSYLSSFDVTNFDGLDTVTGIAVDAIVGTFSF